MPMGGQCRVAATDTGRMRDDGSKTALPRDGASGLARFRDGDELVGATNGGHEVMAERLASRRCCPTCSRRETSPRESSVVGDGGAGPAAGFVLSQHPAAWRASERGPASTSAPGSIRPSRRQECGRDRPARARPASARCTHPALLRAIAQARASHASRFIGGET